ncbi:hypothetical protein BSIN_1454 [Burkholderia singularis]|uniref:Uncharacterized protein n=1 Tax=Burkholderia singularis TaxID=1503053 RepID=A0A238GYW0_9BURK|nr:hypothetical protein BSIN_1454 [Burkholderia singularis]
MKFLRPGRDEGEFSAMLGWEKAMRDEMQTLWCWAHRRCVEAGRNTDAAAKLKSSRRLIGMDWFGLLAHAVCQAL